MLGADNIPVQMGREQPGRGKPECCLAGCGGTHIVTGDISQSFTEGKSMITLALAEQGTSAHPALPLEAQFIRW